MTRRHEAFTALVNTIAEYESDTFSSNAESLTRLEAEEIADDLIYEATTDLTELQTLDGGIISEAYQRLFHES